MKHTATEKVRILATTSLSVGLNSKYKHRSSTEKRGKPNKVSTSLAGSIERRSRIQGMIIFKNII